MAEVKSFFKWMVEEKRETPTIFKLVQRGNYFYKFVDMFVKEAYKNDKTNITLFYQQVDKNDTEWDDILIEFYVRYTGVENRCFDESITLERGMTFEEADKLISEIIYNFIVKKITQ